MGITTKPTRSPTPRASESDITAFISGAPDAKGQGAAPAAPAASMPAEAPARPKAAPATTRKHPISLTVQPQLLARVDDKAARMGLSRAAGIAVALSRWVESEG